MDCYVVESQRRISNGWGKVVVGVLCTGTICSSKLKTSPSFIVIEISELWEIEKGLGLDRHRLSPCYYLIRILKVGNLIFKQSVTLLCK